MYNENLIYKFIWMSITTKKKIILLIILTRLAIQSNSQQIPNAGFENWTNLRPDGWETNSCPLCDPPYETYIVRQDSDACQGTYSAKFISNGVLTAWAETNIISTLHPIQLFACVKSNIEIGDSVKIDLLVYYNGNISDEGHWVNKSTISTYTNQEISISQNSAYVDSIKIKISGGIQVNTTLFADNLSFIQTNEIQENKNDLLWSLSPSVFSDFTWLKFNNLNHNKFVLTIYNTDGQLVKTISDISNNSLKIDKENLTNGVYFFKLSNNRMISACGKFIIK